VNFLTAPENDATSPLPECSGAQQMNPFIAAKESLNVDVARADLMDQGWTIIGNVLDRSSLDAIRSEIDALAQAPEVEINYGGSEHRIWHADQKSELVGYFKLFSDHVISAVESETIEAFNVLAIRNRTLSSDDAKLRKGRWHMDSFKRQLKVFVFLSDVTEKSGPFEMIPRSQRYDFKIRHLIAGDLIAPKDLFDGTRKYQHLEEELISRIVDRGYESKAFAVPAGTIALVDTSSVHRARPCVEGERYALTSYYK
jgi:hypothetical protein